MRLQKSFGDRAKAAVFTIYAHLKYRSKNAKGCISAKIAPLVFKEHLCNLLQDYIQNV